MKKFGSTVILAGGKSSRMGFDKKDLIINGEPLLVSMTRKLRKLFNEIILITNENNTLDIFDKVSKDLIESKGPLSGIYTGLKLSSSQYVYFIACDMPIIKENYILHMKECIEARECEAVVTKYKGWVEPFNAFYSKDIMDKIKENLDMDRRNIYGLIEKLCAIYIDEKDARKYSEEFEMFYNLNTKKDIEEFLRKYS